MVRLTKHLDEGTGCIHYKFSSRDRLDSLQVQKKGQVYFKYSRRERLDSIKLQQ